jgi:uncharacterized protein (TIGR02611 family)
MEAFKHSWKRVPSSVRKLLIFIIGWLVVIAGLAMLLLPGPGWAAIFLGFAILATEFTSAERVRNWLVAQLKAAIAWVKSTWQHITRRKN